MGKADCYQCKYRRNFPGDTHSCCHYPGNKTGFFDFFEEDNLKNMISLNIKADLYGFKMGWFFWPVNFDPAWLENCDGFTPKDE